MFNEILPLLTKDASNFLKKLKLRGIFSELLSRIGDLFPIRTPDGNKFCKGYFSLIYGIYFRRIYDTLFHPKKGWTVVDVGAHVGVYTLRVSKMVDDNGLVVAIEPEPANFKVLLHHIKINRCNNVVPVKLALGAHMGKAKLYITPWTTGHSIALKKSSKYIEIPLVTFDSLMKRLHINHVDLVKMNAEGAELDILKGIRETSVDRYVIGAHHTKNQDKRIMSVLASRGFEVASIKETGARGSIVYAKTRSLTF